MTCLNDINFVERGKSEAIADWQEQLDCLGPYADPYLLYQHLKSAPVGAEVGHLSGYVDARRFCSPQQEDGKYFVGYLDGVEMNAIQFENQFERICFENGG